MVIIYWYLILYAPCLKLTIAVREASGKKKKRKLSVQVGQFVVIECLCVITAHKQLIKPSGKPRVQGKEGGERAEMQTLCQGEWHLLKPAPVMGSGTLQLPFKNFLWKLGLIWIAGDELRGLRGDLAHADCVSQFEINFFVYFWPPDVLTDLVLWCRVCVLKEKM